MNRALAAATVATGACWLVYLGAEGNGWLYGVTVGGLVVMGLVSRRWWVALLAGFAVIGGGFVLAANVLWEYEELPDTVDDQFACDAGCILTWLAIVAIAVFVLVTAGTLVRLAVSALRRRRGRRAATPSAP